MKKLFLLLIISSIIISCSSQSKENVATDSKKQSEWVSLFNGKNLEGWYVRGKAVWDVKDGILIGDGGMGHIYTVTQVTDFEVIGTFRISDNGNSGLYFRANPPEDNKHGWPTGYEAQIDNHQDAHTGWMWKPGNPTAKAKKLITKDNEWFTMKVKMVGDQMQIWVNEELMTEYKDADFTKGHFAIQGHNPGQIIEIKELSYRDLSVK
ncbi:MAG: DUF1080 domain-containing protein [Ignavibacteriae bacterium]|nr:DUF1080 domain-containing protein [Ignavibacteriota bacterium]